MGRGSVEQRLIGAVCCAALGAFWSMLSTLRAAILSTNIVMAHILTAPGGRSASAWGRAEPTLLFFGTAHIVMASIGTAAGSSSIYITV